MEGPLEIKDSAPDTEEPIKSEVPVQSPNSSDRSDGAASPPPTCSICLGKLLNTSFTDSCLHQFCFTCLLQWSKIKTECPLCKQTFKSIIHNVRSEEDYDQYHVQRELASQMPHSQVLATLDLNYEVDLWESDVRQFLYRTTMAGNRRHGMMLNPEQVARREQLPSIAPQVSRGERRRRRANPTDYRRTIYRLGIWATSLPDVFGRFRECSAEYYRREPRELNRLIPWLNRELQVLLNNNAPHVAYVMRIILEALSRYDIRSPEFRDLVRPYFRLRTDHFVHELLNYARTNFDLVGYDQSVTYLPQGLSNEYVHNVVSPSRTSSSSSSSDDSDVRVLDEAIDLRVNTEIPNVGPHPISMPGPSTVAQAFRLEPPYSVPDVLTISSNTSSSDDDCEVIGYVKPRHERTPEIIELISSDEEANVSQAATDNVQSTGAVFYSDITQPSTSYSIKEGSPSSSTDSDTDSDSDYTCRRSRRYQRVMKKSRKSVTAKRRDRSTSTRSRNRTNRKRGNRRSIQHSVKRRLDSSSDSSSQDMKLTKSGEKRSERGQYFTRGMVVRVRQDLIKKEERYREDDSSSSVSSSETDSAKSRTVRKSRRKYTSSSDFENGKNERATRIRGKTKQTLDELPSSKESNRTEQRYKGSGQSRSRSSSASSYSSQKEKRVNHRREFQRNTSGSGTHDDTINRDLSRKEHELRPKTKAKKDISNSSDSDEDHFRSNSQCSNYSSKSYTHPKKSKHKDRRKSKERKESVGRTYNSSSLSTSSATNSVSASLKTDNHSASKHSDSKSNSNSKERHKSRKSHKESKHRRSQNDSKSKSKKKRRRIRSPISSNSE